MARTPIDVQKAVVFALFIRELKTRFGSYRLGYFWALLEPIAHVLILTMLWYARGKSEFSGIPVPMFLIIGVMPFLFFRITATSCMNAIKANQGLFNYRQVRPVDPVLSRLILESIIHFFVYIILLLGAAWFFSYDIWFDDFLGLIVISLSLLLLTVAISLIMSVYGALYPEAMKMFPVIVFRVMYFTSGVIFPLSEIPREYHEWLLWNPMLHVIELSHHFYSKQFISPDVSVFYVLAFAIVALTIGLLSYRVNWVRMVMS